jgi:hypothetical protein
MDLMAQTQSLAQSLLPEAVAVVHKTFQAALVLLVVLVVVVLLAPSRERQAGRVVLARLIKDLLVAMV